MNTLTKKRIFTICVEDMSFQFALSLVYVDRVACMNTSI